MDKLVCTVGMGFIIMFVKMKNWLENVAELVKGAEGFLLIMGICLAALAIVSVIMLAGRRKTA